MLSSSMHLLSILLLAAVSRGCAQTALSAWTSGVATNYGGPDDGDSPTEATFGLLDVSTFVPHACGVFTMMSSYLAGQVCSMHAFPM